MTKSNIEDCLRIVPDRFELVLLAGKRAREVAMTVGDRQDKDDVMALKEIGSGYLDMNELRQRLVYAIHNIPYLSKEESEELGDLEMYEGYEAEPVGFYNLQENETNKDDEQNKLRIDDQGII